MTFSPEPSSESWANVATQSQGRFVHIAYVWKICPILDASEGESHHLFSTQKQIASRSPKGHARTTRDACAECGSERIQFQPGMQAYARIVLADLPRNQIQALYMMTPKTFPA